MRKIIIGVIGISLLVQTFPGCVAKAINEEKVKEKSLKLELNEGSFKGIDSFEDKKELSYWNPKNGGMIEVSPNHFKHGTHSMKWTWEKGSTLIRKLTKAEIDKINKAKSSGIKIWIYNEKAIDDVLTFNYGTKNQIRKNNSQYTNDFNLNFKGWRGFWINYKQDALRGGMNKDTSDQNIKIMEIVPPDSSIEGNIFLDVVEVAANVPEYGDEDFQIKINRNDLGGTWNRTLYHWNKKPNISMPSTITENQKADFEKIANKYDEWVLGKDLDLTNLTEEALKIRNESLQNDIKKAKKTFEMLNIVRHEDGTITGMPLFAERSLHKPKFSNINSNVFLPLALDYKLNGNQKSMKKLQLLFDYYTDQGWAAGSALGTLYHQGNNIAGYIHALYLVRKDLVPETFQKHRDAVKWYINFGKAFDIKDDEFQETTADEVRTKMFFSLLYVLMMENNPQKVQYMQSLLKWYDGALSIAPGYADLIKPDYSGFHHNGVYMSAYAPYALHVSAIVTYLLSETDFSMPKQAHENLKNALMTQYIAANKYTVPFATSGRLLGGGASVNKSIIPAYMYMAKAGKPGENGGIDEEMAGVFLDLWKPETSYLKKTLLRESKAGIMYRATMGDMQLMLAFAANDNIKVTPIPQGYWMKPYSGLSIYRGDHWMVATKGWSQYVWDYECGYTKEVNPDKKAANAFGRYLSYGSIQLFTSGDPISNEGSGYNIKQGWNWNRWSGTTAINLPLEKLHYFNGGKKDRNFSDEIFLGGVSIEGKNGLFGMKLHDTAFNPSFRANKSVFYFNNEIIVLGSDIKNDDTKHHTETTLFQNFMIDGNMPIYYNSKAITKFPYKKEGKEDESAWLMDAYGNGYIIPNAKGLHIKRSKQESRLHSTTHVDMDNSKFITKGDYSTAWIDHGTNPSGEDYEYVILVQPSLEEVEKHAKAPDYEILQKDSKAHIINHKPSNTMGYVIFDKNIDIPYGIVKGVSVPSMLMVKNKGNEKILSVTDPDLRLVKNPKNNGKSDIEPSKMKKMYVTIRGKWSIKDSVEGVNIIQKDSSFTVIEYNAVDGKNFEVVLSEDIGA
ncbi:MAG: polysaccharide lyase beta-sandwich domain-containing protein [Anaeromicrobium sp.]|jgi:hypothetical protein|uniref:chondroitinase family polysaccharide lyase n=1 Tax=Anaeromicrobium sp. TaxID=1929132 RepID=UPI0025F87F26|nr:chondroitinase family polysaccharide lyase [Anaeromicrobium sp.]MCT4595477.1 polysaccharide lyase beta-sandwich domain-containing protein [Anaeromicrobium sp.]